jgi:hypothetical protein
VICVLPHPDGWAVMQKPGTYPDGKNQKTVFRAGEVFARHGSSSERWSQPDVHAIRTEIRRQEAEIARRELRNEFAELLAQGAAAQANARAPASTLTLDLDLDTLTGAVIEQLRVNDLIPLKLLLNGAPGRVIEEAAKDGGDVDGLLDRLTGLAGTLTVLDHDEEVRAVIEAFGTIYNTLVAANGLDRHDLSIPPDDLRLRLITRAYALGALLVRREKWTLVRQIAAMRPLGIHDESYWSNWLVHADVMAARAGYHADAQQSNAYRSTILFAQERISALLPLRPDLPADDDRIVTSLCQFSFLACLVAIDTAGEINPDPFLAQFGRSSRRGPIRSSSP